MRRWTFAPTTTIARFLLAYVFVYYYVFVYVGCTVCLWLIFRMSGTGSPQSEQKRGILLILLIAFGLIVGSYLDPLLSRRGLSESLIKEIRMRDIPFWLTFAGLGVLTAASGTLSALREMRLAMVVGTLIAYIIYAAVRLFGLGDAADYDSIACFGYAAMFCAALFALDIQLPFLATLGSGSYFIYLWHIFVVMILRDHAALRQFGPIVDTAITYAVTSAIVILALLSVRRFSPPRFARWLGA